MVYGEETLGAMFGRGESRCDGNRAKATSLKRIVSRWRDFKTSVQIQSNKIAKKSRRGGEKV